jgi:transposase
VISHEKRQRAQRAAAVVGIDAGKFKHALVVRPRGGADSKPLTFPVTRTGFERADEYIRRLSQAAPAEILVGIEFAGSYGFTLAHHLHGLGYQVVSIPPVATKAWKRATHGMSLKTDEKDALNITDLAAQGNFASFPFLATSYAELRYLVSGRERLALLRRGTLTRLKSILHLVWPEFEALFPTLGRKKTALALLAAFPGPGDVLGASKRRVLKVLAEASRGHMGEEMYEVLCTVARASIGLVSAQGALREEIPLLLEQMAFHDRQIVAVEAKMITALSDIPEAAALLTIPKMGAVTAAVFLGATGDPRAYSSSREVIKLAGLTLVEHSSGVHKGRQRISKSGRPTLRTAAYLFAVRHIQKDGLYRADYERMLARNGGNKMKALVAMSRDALRLWFSVARACRRLTPEPPGAPRTTLALALGGWA